MVSTTPPARFRFAQLKRSHVAVTTIALLLVLDIGRSINARVGYTAPVSQWRPSPSNYAESHVASRSGPGAQYAYRRTCLCAQMCRLPRT
jgi:hypothetical protein